MTSEEEAQQKAEHEENPDNCIYPYPEHDESNCETVDGIWGGTCRRCGAQLGGFDVPTDAVC